MRARDLAAPYPVVTPEDTADSAARLLAREDVDVLLVRTTEGRLVGALHDLGLLDALLPHYLVEDRALARMLDEQDSDGFWKNLEGKSVADLLAAHPAPLHPVAATATVVEVAAEMLHRRTALVAVLDGEELLGGITTSVVLTALLGDR